MKETAKYWCADDIGDLELLKATYISHTFSRHTHAGYVVGMIERGVQVFYYRGKMHAATPGDVVVINPDEVHTGYSGSDSGWTYRMFYPSIEILRQVADGIKDSAGDMPHFKEAVIKDRRLAYEIKWLHGLLETSQSALDRQGAFYDVMGRLILRHACNAPALKTTGGQHRIIKSAVDYIHNNLCENISLEELSRHAGLSPFYFSRMFRQYTGLPPHAYRKQQRVLLAKQLLRSNMPIAQVAVESGFSDQSHLTRFFKQIVGVTPGQYYSHAK
jgi:AraC-like DNA-binding protein